MSRQEVLKGISTRLKFSSYERGVYEKSGLVRWQVTPDLHATFNLGGIAASVAGVQLEEPWSTLQQRLEQTLFGTAMGQLKRLCLAST